MADHQQAEPSKAQKGAPRPVGYSSTNSDGASITNTAAPCDAQPVRALSAACVTQPAIQATASSSVGSVATQRAAPVPVPFPFHGLQVLDSRLLTQNLTPQQKYKLAALARIVFVYNSLAARALPEEDEEDEEYDEDEEDDEELEDELPEEISPFHSLSHMVGMSEEQLLNIFAVVDEIKARAHLRQQLRAAPQVSEPAHHYHEADVNSLKAEAIPEVDAKIAEEPKKLGSEQVNKRKCWDCKRKLPLTAITCRCGFTYCSDHRMAESHNCSFNYKAAGKRKLAQENPVVRPQKVAKIC